MFEGKHMQIDFAPITFDQALEHVLSTKGAAFAYTPMIGKDGKPYGGTIYIMHYESDYEKEPEDLYEYYLLESSGRFYSTVGGEDSYAPEEIPAEAKQLKYYRCPVETSVAIDASWATTEAALKVLNGIISHPSEDCEMCPECENIMFATGVYTLCSHCS